MGGFNPLALSSFIAKKSAAARWLSDPKGSARKFNYNDYLVVEVLFLIHDYLHVWAYTAISSINPRLGFGLRPITEKNIEDFVFCHLLSESVATVGLDYWYLSTVDLNKVCPIGSWRNTLTVDYREKFSDEYHKFNPELEVQNKSFFEKIHRFYCSGIFGGFNISAFISSPIIMTWLDKELSYGETQRVYTRLWLRSLAGMDTNIPRRVLARQVSCGELWKKELIDELGDLLWAKVKKDENLFFKTPSFAGRCWKSPRLKSPDFRFINLMSVRDSNKAFELISRQANFDRNFEYLFYQYVCGFDYESFDKELIKLFDHLVRKRDFPLVRHLFKRQKRLEGADHRPKDLFFLS